MSEREPGWQPRRFRCLKCKHTWGGWLPMFVPVKVMLAVLKATNCPKCHAGPRQVIFDDLKPEPKEPPP
jgi:Zn finger protein HypA/HybF involved in hydrogenase expression